MYGNDGTAEAANERSGGGMVPQRMMIMVSSVAMVVGLGIGMAIGATAFDSGSDDDAAVTETTEGEDAALTRFEAAKDECAAGSSYITVLDDGAALELSSEGEESVGATLDEVFCVLDALDVPESVTSRASLPPALSTARWTRPGTT